MTYNEVEVLKTRKQRRAIIAKQLRHLESCVEQVRGLLILESMERPSTPTCGNQRSRWRGAHRDRPARPPNQQLVFTIDEE